MKKNLIALSLSLGGALLCATGAQAQSSVQLMGLTDVFVGSMKTPVMPAAARWSTAAA